MSRSRKPTETTKGAKRRLADYVPLGVSPEPFEGESGVEYVPFVGRFLLPRRYIILPSEPIPTCQLVVEVEDGRPVCTAVRRAGKDAPPITARLLRRIPVDGLVHESTFAVQIPVPDQSLEDILARPPRTDDPDDFHKRLRSPKTVEEHREAAAAQRESARRGRGIPLTESHYQQVAEVYREAQKRRQPAVKAVQERFTVSRATASRWVRDAKAHDMIPKGRRDG